MYVRRPAAHSLSSPDLLLMLRRKQKTKVERITFDTVFHWKCCCPFAAEKKKNGVEERI